MEKNLFQLTMVEGHRQSLYRTHTFHESFYDFLSNLVLIQDSKEQYCKSSL